MNKAHKIKHGSAYSKEYNSWCSMKQRCLNKNAPDYYRYGGIGIRICERYKEKFQNFFEDIGVRPTPKHSVDRINNDLHYSCGICGECISNDWKMNVHWATKRKLNCNVENFGNMKKRKGEKYAIEYYLKKLNCSEIVNIDATRSN